LPIVPKKSKLALAASALILALSIAPRSETQQTPQKSNPSGGSATGGIYSPVLDEKNRPITGGGFVDGAPVYYEDVTQKTGMNSFRNHTGNGKSEYILEVATGGVAMFDYDGDGLLDVYFVNGSTYAALDGKEPGPRAALFHNNGDGTFTDVTEKAGVGNYRWGMGVAVGDFNNDGCPDLYVTNYGKNRLYRNNCDGTFTDIAEQAGVAVSGAQPIWSTGATFGDYDRDGKLDLFVSGYLKWDVHDPPAPGSKKVDYNFCQFRGKPTMCGPRGLPGERDFLFHNNGDGTFTEVAQKAGVSDPSSYFGFGTAFVDVNDDGWLDLVVANDSTPRYLYLNRHDGTFENASYVSGFALNENGREQASMGLGIGDFDNDGRLDFYLTNFSDDYNTLFHNDGNANFSDVSFARGIASPTIPFLGWGTSFIDFDNDGWKDIFVVNGHLYPDIDSYHWGTTWAQRPLLFRNIKGKHFDLVPAATGSGLAVVIPGRGAAFGDLFNDGHIAVAINNLESPPTVLRNVTKNSNNWIELKLIGGPKSPRDAIGAKVFLTAGGIRQRQDVISGGGYISQNDMRLHFGLATAAKVDKLEILWPDGAREEIKPPAVNKIWTIKEGKGLQ
jgi:enediyne biosynthesis protein E4